MNKRQLKKSIISWFFLCIFFSNAQAAEIAAELQWSKRLILSTTETGVVEKVQVTPGQTVKKGTVLLELDEREFITARSKARAKRLAAKTSFEEAKREQIRAQDLFDRTMLSEHDLQVTKNNAAHARAAYLQAIAGLKKANLALERSRVTAPYDAVVIDVYAQQGQTVISSQKVIPLILVAENRHMIARAWLNNSDLNQYARQKAKSVKVGRNQYTVVSQYVVGEANDKDMYALNVLIDIGDAKLYAGQTASIIFP